MGEGIRKSTKLIILTSVMLFLLMSFLLFLIYAISNTKSTKNDFLSGPIHIDSSHLEISSVESPNYQCTGSCSCKDEDAFKRRSSLSALPLRGIKYLTVAATSIIAINRAKSHFNSECVNRLKDHCALSSIQSSIEECVDYVPETVEELLETRDDDGIIKVYCEGNCVPNRFEDPLPAIVLRGEPSWEDYMGAVKDLDTPDEDVMEKLDGLVSFYAEDECHQYKTSKEFDAVHQPNMSLEQFWIQVKEWFVLIVLKKYCEEQGPSLVKNFQEVGDFFKKTKIKRNEWLGSKLVAPYCTETEKDKYAINSSVRCVIKKYPKKHVGEVKESW